MKIKTISRLVLATALISMLSCYYDNPPIAEPVNIEDISFSTHIIPILDSYCSTASCHDGTSEPNLLAEHAYNELLGGYVNRVIPEESVFYKSVAFESGADPMPPGGPQIPDLDQDLIRLWIVKGALND